jgi:hypothetical protein
MLFFPERLALAGFGAYLLLWVVAPLNAVSPLSLTALTYILTCYFAFLLGCKSATISLGWKDKTYDQPRVASYWLWFWIWMLLGVAGLIFRLYDKFVLRDAFVIGSVLETREVLADTSAGPLAAIGGVLYPFCYVPIFMIWIRERRGESSVIAVKWLAAFVALLPALDALILLSRSQMLVAFSMLYFAVSCALYGGKVMPKKIVIPVFLGLSLLLGITVSAFLMRLDEMELKLIDSLMGSAYAELLVPNELALRIISGDHILISIFLSNITPIFQYYLHGIYEFCLLWERPDSQIFLNGIEHFFPYIKLLSMAGIVDQSVISQQPYLREGVFTTFFGPLWVDFGFLSILIIFIFGFLVKRIANIAREREPAALPLHSFFCVVVFFFPVVNLIVSAQGMYTINAFVIFYFLMRKKLSVF